MWYTKINGKTSANTYPNAIQAMEAVDVHFRITKGLTDLEWIYSPKETEILQENFLMEHDGEVFCG